MMSAERAFYYCQAVCANKQFEAAKHLSRGMIYYGRRALERKSPEDAAAEETCSQHSPQWGWSMVGLVHGGINPWLGLCCPVGMGSTVAAHSFCWRLNGIHVVS